MPTPVAAARQCLAPAAVTALDAAVASARRRAHAQTTSLHLVSSLLPPNAPPLLRDALNRARSAAHAPRLQLRALDLCFHAALNRLPSASSTSKDGSSDGDPPVSNSLMAAVKRSQANQRRNPDTFHLYHHHHHPPTAAVKVDLSHLLLAVLDDPLVGRVFADAGFRTPDIKLAVLRPVPLLGLSARARPPPLFLCSFLADDADAAGAPPPGEDNCRRIADILSRGRNPMLVGVGAASAAAEFAAAAAASSSFLPYRILHVTDSNSINDLTIPSSSASGLILSIGDLNDLLLRPQGNSNHRVVSEVSRLLETHTGRRRLWVMGWSATYETYLAFLSKFPLLDKDWDLQLLPVTAVRPPPAAAPDAGAATTTTGLLPATPTSRSSLIEAFAPFGGSSGDSYEANNFAANSCPQALWYQLCNNRYEHIKRSGLRVEDNQQGGRPSLLQNGSMMGPNSGFDALKVIDDDLREVIKPSAAASTAYTNTTANSVSSPSISNQRNDDLALNLQVRQSKSDEHLQDRGGQSQHSNSSSVVSVATDLVLGTPHSAKSLNSASREHVGDAERSVNPTPSKVYDLNLKPTQPFVYRYSWTRSYTNLGQTSPGTPHSVASGGNSAFGQCHRPSSLRAAQSSDMSNYKLLVERLFKSVGRQEEALSAISESIMRCRSIDQRRGSNKRNDIWFSFHGPDSIAKRRVAAALAELMHDSSDNMVYLDLGHQDWGDSNFRGKTGTDFIVEELRKKRRCVIFLDNIDKADCLVQDTLSRAIEIGRLDRQGRLVDLNDSIVVLSTRMNRDFKNTSLAMEDGHVFSEEKILAARGRQLKILVERGTGNITGVSVGKVVVSSGYSVTSIQASLYSGSVSKRKLNISDGQEKIQESPSTSKRLHITSSVPFDLNLPVDEGEAHDADDDSGSHDNSSGNPNGSIESLLRSVDESISFKPFDFGKLYEDMLKEFSSTVSNILGSDCRMEIDVGAMEQILAAAWASDSEKRPVRPWLEQVFASSLEQVRLKCKNVNNFTVRLVACEDLLLKDDGFGALLPSRIILGW